jgi:hypothetical protein
MKTLVFLPLLLLAGLLYAQQPAVERSYNLAEGVGAAAEGAGLAIADLDGDDRPDIIALAYDSVAGPNSFKYRVGRDADAFGQPQTWSPAITVSGVGDAGEGAGLAVAAIDANPRPELVVMAYNSLPGANDFRYRVGANVSARGEAVKWGPVFCIPGVGDHAEGAGVALYDLDQNGRPDMILMAYDAQPGANEFRYRVGKDLDADGRTRNWSGMTIVDGVGQPADGAGLAVADLNDNGLPDMIVMAYVIAKGERVFRYKIGYDLDANGQTANWTAPVELPGIGGGADGADVAIYDLSGDDLPEVMLMAYRASPGTNEFRFKVLELTPVK